MNRFLLCSIALFCLIPAGCNGPARRTINTTTLNIGNQIEVQDLDPHIVTGIPEFNVISGLLEGLVGEDPRDLHPIGGTADSWQVSSDGLRWTFHIRPNARWSNGDTLTANDFVFSMQRILSPKLGAEYAYMLHCIKNGVAYNTGKLDDFSRVGVRAVAPDTLQITLERPVPYFLSLITHHSWYPVHRAAILASGAIDQRGTAWTRPENFVGNGPFVLKAWKPNEIITLEKNNRYWDASVVALQTINFYPIDNTQTEERAFRSGALQVTTNVPLNRIPWYRSHAPGQLRTDPYLGTYYYLLNVAKPPFTDYRVRQALSYAIDRKSLVENILKGGQIPAVAYTPVNTAGYTSPATIGFDTVMARALLKEAGYDSTHPFPKISILYNILESHHLMAQAIAHMWKQYLGIDVELVNQEWKVYLASMQKRDYLVARAGWIGDYNDPNTFLDMWVSAGGNNRAGFASARYDSLIAAAARCSVQTERYTVLGQAESLLMHEMPIIPIYFYTNVFLISPAVQGWYPNILNHHPYKFISLSAQAPEAH